MRALVVGGSGWLGSAVAAALEGAGFAVTATRSGARDPSPSARLRSLDLLDPGAAIALLRELRPELVVHAAGRTAIPADPALLYRLHVEGTVRLLEAIEASCRDCHFIALGSAAEYGTRESGRPIGETDPALPATHYGLSKLLQTELEIHAARTLGLAVTVLRAFNPIGEGARPGILLGDLFGRLRVLRASGGGRLVTGPLGAVRDLVPLELLAEAVARVARARAPLGVYNVATGVGTGMRDVAGWLVAASPFPVELAEGAAEPGHGAGDWSVGDPASLAAAIGPLPALTAREVVLRAYGHDVLDVGGSGSVPGASAER